MKKIACVGILVADVIVESVTKYPEKGLLEPVNSITMHNGGNAMTAAINLKKLGVVSNMVGMVGDDMFGEYLRGRLESEGINTKGLKADKTVQTSASVLMIDTTGERSFFHCVGANAAFSIDDIDMSVIEESDVVFVTGSFLMNTFDGEQTMNFLKKCKELGKTTFLDVCYDASGRWGELLNMSMPYIDVFMPSIDEAVEIAKKTDLNEIADVFFDNGVGSVVIKVGSKGCYIRKTKEEQGKMIPACTGVKAVDTTGAGDSFCSGFLASYARGKSFEECAKFANATGAHCVMEKGATSGIKSYDEILEFANKQYK